MIANIFLCYLLNICDYIFLEFNLDSPAMKRIIILIDIMTNFWNL